MNIITVTEGKRGCGYREEGGLYLRTDGIGRYCGALPIPLTTCPTCHVGIKPTRGWQWINLAALAAVRGCTIEGRDEGCGDCPIADAKIQEVGLLWIGEQYYPTPEAFNAEGMKMGLSRRIQAIPKNFRLGETWVALAHRKAIEWHGEVITYTAAIFHVFKPSRLEYVVKRGDKREKLEEMEKRGVTLVRVIKKLAEGDVLCEVCQEPYTPTAKKPNHDCWK